MLALWVRKAGDKSTHCYEAQKTRLRGAQHGPAFVDKAEVSLAQTGCNLLRRAAAGPLLLPASRRGPTASSTSVHTQRS